MWCCFLTLASLFAVSLGCVKPFPPVNGTLHPLTSQITPPMFSITYKCNQGYTPTEVFTVTCLHNGTWSQNATDLLCIGMSILRTLTLKSWEWAWGTRLLLSYVIRLNLASIIRVSLYGYLHRNRTCTSLDEVCLTPPSRDLSTYDSFLRHSWS